MPKAKFTDHELITCHATYLAKDRSWTETALSLGLTKSSVQRRLEAYKERFGDTPTSASPTLTTTPLTIDDVIARLRKGPMTLDQIADAMNTSPRYAQEELDSARKKGINLHEINGQWGIEKAPPLRPTGVNARHELFSDENNHFRFGFVTDNHLGSKYSRLDVLNDMYDRFERNGITQVFNAGNYIDGEARFNKFDLAVHGMDAQLRFLAENYPQRPSIVTHFVAGDDHEGWYGQREGIDIGRWTERVMQEHGRNDFRYLGYMEADVDLVNVNTEKSARARVVHPGGGSAYAISYTMQKLVESYEGGDKPAVVLAGHYHKMEIVNYRNVWCIQGGTTEDQTPFMRKKKLEAHVGGILVDLEQDPNTGAIISCNGICRYFNQDYYRQPGKPKGERFSYGGKVNLPRRTLGGV
jgi:hypothetical protein